MKNYDVAVIGAGPCGLHLAALLSKKGIKTLVIEKDLIGSKPRSWITWEDEVVKRGFKNTIINKIQALGFISYLGSGYDFNHSKAAIVNPQLLLAQLKSRAVKAGAEIMEGETFISCRAMKNSAAIRTDKNIYSVQYCADCSGAGSKMQAAAGGRLPKTGSMGCYAVELGGLSIAEPGKAVIFEAAFPGKNYFWLLPYSGTTALAGCFFFEELNARTLPRAKASLEKYMKAKKLHGKKLRHISGNIPLNGRGVFMKKRVFFCGDAASSPLPSSGYGLLRAMDEAEILAASNKKGIKKGVFDYNKKIVLARYPGFELHYFVSDILKNISPQVLNKAILAMNDNEPEFVDDFMRGSDLTVVFAAKALRAILSAFRPQELADLAVHRDYKEFMLRVARDYPKATPELISNMVKWMRKRGVKDLLEAINSARQVK